MDDVLLVNPPCKSIAFSGSAAATYSPLGLAYLGSGLINEGFSVSAIDSDVMGYQSRDVVDAVLERNPRILGLSVMSTTLRDAYLIVSSVVESGFRGEIIVGGPHITALPETVGKMGLEWGVLGEGEESLKRLCNAIVHGTEDAEKIPGVIASSKKKTAKPAYIKDLDALPCPDRSLFPPKRYSHVSVISSRGCPHSCSFCVMPSVPARMRSAENVVYEVECAVRDFGNRMFSFVDDNFVVDRGRAVTLCNLIADKKMGISWNCQARADCLDEELLAKMKSAGCRYIFFGVESGSEEVRMAAGKNVSDKEYVKAFKLCRKHKIKTRAYFMLGFPGETRKDVESTLNFPKKIQPDDVDYCVTDALPATALAEKLVRDGIIQKDAWDKFMRGEAEHPVCLPEGLSREQTRFLCIEGYRRFYFSPGQLAGKISRMRSKKDFNETLAHAVYTLKANMMPGKRV